MPHSPELIQFTMAERQREADHNRLASLARRAMACCSPATLRERITGAIRTAGDACCPSDAERLARTRSVLGA